MVAGSVLLGQCILYPLSPFVVSFFPPPFFHFFSRKIMLLSNHDTKNIPIVLSLLLSEGLVSLVALQAPSLSLQAPSLSQSIGRERRRILYVYHRSSKPSHPSQGGAGQ